MKARVMLIMYVKNMKVVKALTLVYPINKVSQFFLKSNKQDEVINKSPAGNYMFKVNNRNTRTSCEIRSKLTIKIPERRQWCHSGIFIVNFEHISYLFLVFLLFTFSR